MSVQVEGGGGSPLQNNPSRPPPLFFFFIPGLFLTVEPAGRQHVAGGRGKSGVGKRLFCFCFFFMDEFESVEVTVAEFIDVHFKCVAMLQGVFLLFLADPSGDPCASGC